MAQTKVKLIADDVIVQSNLNASHGITTADIGENASYLYYTDARVSSYLSTNGYATQTDIVAAITASAPVTLDTLNELAAALGDDPNFAATTATSLGLKAPLASPSFTGNATFAGNVTANVGTFNSDSGGTGLKIIGRSAANSGALRYYQNNGTTQTARIESNDSIFEINSISNLPIQLKTNDTLALTLDTSQNSTFAGDIGIGISPGENLHIFKSDATALIQASNTSGIAQLQFFPRDSSNVAHLQSIKGVDSDLTFLTGGNSGNSYVPTERIRIDSSGRTSIIGVFESSASQGILNLKQSSGVGSLGMGFHDTGSNPHFWLQSRSNSNYATTYNLALQPNGGNVGIGTASPAEKLQVAGNIIMQGANTNTGYDRYLKLYGNSDPAANTHRWAGIGLYNNGGNNVNELGFFTGSGDSARTEKLHIGSSGDIKITTNGKFLQGVRNTGSATIDMIGFVGGTDTLQIKGGTSGAANVISFYDTGGFIGTWYNGNFGIGTTTPRGKLQINGNGNAWGDAPSVRLWDTTNSKGWVVGNVNNYTAGDFYIRTMPSISGDPGSAQQEFTIKHATGNVGIGTASPNAKLDVKNDDGVGNGLHVVADFNRSAGTDAQLILGYYANGTSVTGPVVYAANSKPLLFAAGGTERMRITSGGNVGIGIDSPQAQFCLKNQIANSGTPLSYSTAQQNVLNGYYTTGESPNRYTRYFDIACVGDGDGTNGGGNIRFLTNPIANDTAIERMRITSGGRVTIKNKPNSGLGYDVLISVGTGADGDVGYQTLSQLNTNLAGASDIRFKKNIEIIPNAIEKIKTINGYTFDWDSENEDYNYSEKEGRDAGVIAQEIQKVLPEVVQIATVDRNEEGKSTSGKNYLSVDYKKIIPLLIQGIKEQETSIQELKAEVETLKTQING